MTYIHTGICCRVCDTELVIGDSTVNESVNITLAKFEVNKERRCNKCRTTKPIKGKKTLYIHADGVKRPGKDKTVSYGLSADDITPNELDNQEQVDMLYDVYTDQFNGELDKEQFTVKVMSFIHGGTDKKQFDGNE